MSLARIRWNKRNSGDVTPATSPESAPDWDEEAIDEAMARAFALEDADPDAAVQLRTMAAAARAKLTGHKSDGNAPYDAPALYARMKKFYGMGHREIEEMHFPMFFAYVREAGEINDEEQAQYERAKRQNGASGTASPDAAQGLFIQPEVYQGQTVAL